MDFEEKYREYDHYWGLNPSNEVLLLLKYKRSGSVLDLGVGEGRNALFLAKKGFDVTGVDISRAGVKKFLRLAKKDGLKVRGIVEDISTYRFDKKYDIILSIMTLNFLSKKDIASLIERMKEYTKKNGLNLIRVFTVEDPGYKVLNKKLYYFKKGELKELYRDWEILLYREFLTKPERHGEEDKWHRHAVAVLLARKI